MCNGVYSLHWEDLVGICFNQFCPQGFIKMVDDQSTGCVCDICSRFPTQSIAIDEQFLCGYPLVIDWSIYQLLILSTDINSSIEFPIISFHRLDTPGNIMERCNHFISESVKEENDLQYKVFNSNMFIILQAYF